MADQYDLKNLGLGEVTAATATVATDDLVLIVDPTTKVPRLELVSTVLAAS